MSRASRRWLVPEVVQTSAMDCGPASLKAMMEGHGVPVSYGRLREACQTDVDGTSIDVIEETACRLGLAAEQVMLPLEHILLNESSALPAIAVTRLAGGYTHFVVIWGRFGSWVQVMDPGVGRRWVGVRRFLDELYLHTQLVPADAWREWAGSESFLVALRARLRNVAGDGTDELVEAALVDTSWFSLASLDAAIRMTESLKHAGAIDRDSGLGILRTLYDQARNAPESIPAAYWSVSPLPPSRSLSPPAEEGSESVPASVNQTPLEAETEDGDEQQLAMRGAVLVSVSGLKNHAHSNADAPAINEDPLPPDLAAALAEQPESAWRSFWPLLQDVGLITPPVLAVALLLGVGAVMIEALLFRSLLDLVKDFDSVGQRLALIFFLSTLALALLLAEFSSARELQRLGRHLEIRLRLAFLRKIPRLNDRYFHSRPISDMAERAHSVQRLRALPGWGGQILRTLAELTLTAAGIMWLDAAIVPLVLLAALAAVGVPLLLQPALNERDLRARSHGGALSRFYLDALLGFAAVRAHCAERAVRVQHESLLTEWARASLDTLRLSLLAEGLQVVLTLMLVGGFLSRHYLSIGDSGEFLLLVYWALKLPALGQQFAGLCRQYPAQRNTALRFIEPLGASENAESATIDPPPDIQTTAHSAPMRKRCDGVAIAFQNVNAQAAGHTVLQGINLTITAGSHVAIVGSSGAGKSSLIGLLLGWMQAASGEVRVDDAALTTIRLANLRNETAWLDPSIQLWNQSLLDNLLYGGPEDAVATLGDTLDSADLHCVLRHLPDGLQTQLGEGGACLSGGEGQRVRLGRALLKKDARLVILDEPFRGLDRVQREALMRKICSIWRRATLLCITHDISETLLFERVLVMHGGRIVEDAAPSTLAIDESSRFNVLLAAEKTVRQSLWASDVWKRIFMDGGQVRQGDDK